MAPTTTFAKLLDSSIKNEDVLDALESFIEFYKDQKQKNESYLIPAEIFSERKLGSLEITVKYMKENLSLNYAQIAKVINRNQRTVWGTYNKANQKHKKRFIIQYDEYLIPCSIFLNRERGPLEAIVCYLRDELKLSFKQISEILNRDYNTIWLSYKNGKKNDK
ncbi:MAG: hypothetical protein ACP5N2_02015 [Candidatus Nanoarchaeia archaeon]